MRLTIFNGSPRGKNSNSEVLIQWLTEGFTAHTDIQIENCYLNKVKEHDNQVQILKASDAAIIVFPLYTDAMPGLVMDFFERLEPLKNTMASCKLGFVVHSGFPEAVHSRHVEKYLRWLTNELGTHYWGTIVMGSSEGMRLMPPSMTHGKSEIFRELGRRVVVENTFDPELLRKIAGTEKMSILSIVGFSLLSLTGLTNYYWDSQLKKNSAYKTRFAKPYGD